MQRLIILQQRAKSENDAMFWSKLRLPLLRIARSISPPPQSLVLHPIILSAFIIVLHAHFAINLSR